ncbi:hypothetical protein [Streptomyces sp. NPDC021212]|uniref:hypothetical protein n=1 Tax=Streptomyces sp. NPDC021212 TaxID=3365118 RepID=UPI003796E78B
MLKIGDITYDSAVGRRRQGGRFQAVGPTGPKAGTPQRAVLGSIAFVAANVAGRRSDSATMTGEAGVCGFAAAGLSRVAILAEGRPSNGPPEKRELERINSGIGRNIAAVVSLLKAAALQHRHATL